MAFSVAKSAEHYRQQRIVPAQAMPEQVAHWVRALAAIDTPEVKGRAMATIERHLIHLGRAYRLVGFDNPTASERVRLELKAIRHALRVRQC